MTFYDLNEALDRLLAGVEPTNAQACVGLFELQGRVLAQSVTATRNLPPFSNSAMDGYAVVCSDAGKQVAVSATIFAGDVPSGRVSGGEAIKIMTGAPVPPGCEAVVPFEHTTQASGRVQLPEGIKPGQNIKLAGEELACGGNLFEAGQRLGASHVALLASQGVMAAQVYRPLRVAVISGGDEVIEPWQNPNDYQIYNTNSIALVSALKEAGYEAVYASLSGDDLGALSAQLEAVLEGADAVITTGGISMGEADFTREAFERLGIEIFFHGLNLKPGRPTMTGKIGRKLAFALPGNPLSALVNFHLLVLPALAKQQGAKAYHGDTITAINDEAFGVKGDRDCALLGRLQGGVFRITRGGKYGSGMLLPLAESNALAVFDRSIESVKAGAALRVLPLGAPLVSQRIDAINRP